MAKQAVEGVRKLVRHFASTIGLRPSLRDTHLLVAVGLPYRTFRLQTRPALMFRNAAREILRDFCTGALLRFRLSTLLQLFLPV